jgi:hypothetical protein
MRPGWNQTGMKIEIVNMFTWDRYENHKIFNLFPLPGNFFSRWFLLACVVHLQFQCQGYIRDRSEMYLCLHSFRSEFMLVWSQSAWSSRWNDLRLVWVIFVLVSCKHLLLYNIMTEAKCSRLIDFIPVSCERDLNKILQTLAKFFQNFSQYSFVVHPSQDLVTKLWVAW